jgi:hypothetical protein
MEKIILSPILKNKLDYLPQILFDKSYFGFMESAEEYVNRIYNFIDTIPFQLKHKTSNNQYGEYYARLEVKNKRTIYYLTYNYEGELNYIKNMFTSHELGYYIYIKGIK